MHSRPWIALALSLALACSACQAGDPASQGIGAKNAPAPGESALSETQGGTQGDNLSAQFPPDASSAEPEAPPTPPPAPEPTPPRIEPSGATVATRFVPPPGFTRVDAPDGSFAKYLQSLPLKPDGSPVLYYDGREKSRAVYDAVVDQDISERDLQQCADAIMRLKAEYHYARGEHDKIAFHFVDGFLCDWDTWRSGHRVQASTGRGKSKWITKGAKDSSYENFLKYMTVVFAYASTLSLEEELTPVSDTVRIGDVFIWGGSPGHAVIVVDAAENERGEHVFLLAQSYMPAQQTQILKNLADPDLSPWYSAAALDPLRTPEWTFEAEAHRRFPE